MEQIYLETKLTVFEDFSELNKIENELMLKSLDARKKAYAPYSNFLVGASILLENGEIISGSNQENAAYPAGLCAERTAVYYAHANYPDQKILKIFITASPKNELIEVPIPPCGPCRQSLAEFEINQNHNIEIFFMGGKGKIYKSDSVKNLLPFMFTKEHL